LHATKPGECEGMKLCSLLQPMTRQHSYDEYSVGNG